MTLLKRLFGELFDRKSVNPEVEEEILQEETIKPTAFFLEEYQQWMKAGMHVGLLDYLSEQRAIKRSNPEAENYFFHFDSDASNGFYFHGEDPWSNKDYAFIIQKFSDSLLENGYRLNRTKRLVKQKGETLITIEQFYFKLPLSSRLETPYAQAWGNIEIEHRLVDERTNYVKLMAHTYSDRNYQDARDFEDLVDLLFTKDAPA